MIGIIKIGIGNIASLINLFEELGYEAEAITEPEDLTNYSVIVLPGVGSFDQAISKLEKNGFRDLILSVVKRQEVKIFGICLGMQVLFESSEEGELSGLGILKGSFTKFNTKRTHMGWNTVNPQPIGEPARFYFVHNYALVEAPPQEVEIYRTTYNNEDFISMVKSRNILATQFHPEKSGTFGMKLIKNWIDES
jgi:imidazole glycerol phosphate synthase glutamine amidotransferase subunit